MRSQQGSEPKVVQHIAREFARFLNRVQSAGNDLLGSFLVDNEWDRYVEDANEAVKSIELAGYVVAPKTPDEAMVLAADRELSGAKSLMGARGVRLYIDAVYSAMVQAWQDSRNSDLILDIIAMALARAAEPSSTRRNTAAQDPSYRRFSKSAHEILSELEKGGYVVLPDEATPTMVSAGVSETAQHVQNAKAIGADPEYVKKIFHNVIAARPDECRPKAS